MSDENKTSVAAADISALINTATSTQELQDILTRDRDKQTPPASPPAPAAKPEEKPEPVLYTDTLIIGGKEVEISGPGPEDVIRQLKAAVQAYELGRESQAPKSQPVEKVKTPEELQADRFELESKFRLGQITAKQYLAQSGAVDEYLKDQGIAPEKLKEIVKERDGNDEIKAWQKASDDFLKDASHDWPGGGKLAREILSNGLAELGLLDQPTAASMKRAYEYKKSQGVDFVALKRYEDSLAVGTPAVEQEPPAEHPVTPAAPTPAARTAPPAAPPAPVAARKPRTSSALFNQGGQGGDRTTPKADGPKIDPNDSPQEIIRKFNEATLAQGRHPDDALRESYGWRIQ